MTAKRTTQKVRLDWSRLLGFDQAAPLDDKRAAIKHDDTRGTRLTRLGAKIGTKTGTKQSDISLKRDVRRIGTAAHGLPLYTFRYIGKAGLYEGVMAQDVLAVMPSAVSVGDDGYYRVDYELLGIPFRRLQ